MPRRFLIAPDKFKGSLTAPEAAAAMAAGILQREPDAELDLCPIADGGEGFMETLAAAFIGEWIVCSAIDALGREIASRYYLAETAAGPTAIFEMAETSGLWRLTALERDPLHSTTHGVGMQMRHAISQHAPTRMILGLGGSATNDGGCGMAAALGVTFSGANVTRPDPSNLAGVCRVDARRRIALPKILAACDVDHPLLGKHGATAVFSAQKGATAADQIILEQALVHLVSVCGGQAAALLPGAGAAGGLGFGLLHFAKAELVPGFDLIAKLLGLENRIRWADLVVTGEGSIDIQSLSGKGPVALARLAASFGVPTAGFCGIADRAARASGIFATLHALADSGLPLETLMTRAGPLLTELVSNTDL